MQKTHTTTTAEAQPEKMRWDNPIYWYGVKVGQCQNCFRQEKAVTRHGLCWLCETESKH